MDMSYETAGLKDRVIAKARRTMAERFGKTPFIVPSDFRAVTFCFDDFPASAVEAGARALEDYDARATFYACFGLMGKHQGGQLLFSIEQAKALAARGHEIGCHTYEHVNLVYADKRRITETCDANKKTGSAYGLSLDNFAYPQGGMRPTAKTVLKARYATARSTVSGINSGQCDAYCLKGVPVYEHHDAAVASGMLDEIEKTGGWLIFYTHDIADSPSSYGLSANRLRQLIKECRQRSIDIMTIKNAWAALSR